MYVFWGALAHAVIGLVAAPSVLPERRIVMVSLLIAVTAGVVIFTLAVIVDYFLDPIRRLLYGASRIRGSRLDDVTQEIDYAILAPIAVRPAVAFAGRSGLHMLGRVN